MNKKLTLVIALVLSLVVTVGGYAFAYLTATTRVDVAVAGEEIATIEESVAQPDWDSILAPTEAAINAIAKIDNG